MDIAWTAFSDELEKIAITKPMFVESPRLYSQHGIGGLFAKNEMIWRENPGLAQQFNIPKTGPGVVFFPDPADYSRVHGQHGDLARRIIRRHELTHWMRHMRGERLGEPGLRGVLRTAKGELAAHLSPIHMRLPPQRVFELGQGLPGGVLSSVRHAYKNYPGGVRGALMGGRLGKLIKAVIRR